MCILNAETIKNPFNKTRKMLAAQLEKYHATVRFYSNAFSDPDSERKTDADIADWNAGKIPVALIQPSSAGHGLNLQSGGSTIIWFTMPWSLELYQQTNARLWRQGQRAESVVIQHLTAAGTIDEDIMEALECKDKIQSAMMSAVKARLRK